MSETTSASRTAPAAPGPPPDTLMLLDTPSLYFRAFFGVPRSVRAPDGTPVNAVRGLLDVIARQVELLRPSRLVACFDADWRPAFRVALLPSYKAHRVADPDAGAEEVEADLLAQLPVIDEVLDAFGIARAQAPGYEADDVIGTLATRHDGPVEVLSGDRDLFQLVRDDKPVRVRYSVEKFALVDEASVRARYAVPGRAYADFAVLRGDPSDGLPGVPGVGPKTASALVDRFGSLDGVIAALDSGQAEGFPAGARRKLEAARDYLAVAADVVRVVCDVDLAPFDDRLPAVPADPDRLVELCGRWGVSTAAARLVTAISRGPQRGRTV